MPSPFPGMDPWLENPARWPDFHLRLIATLGDMLMSKVRPRYVVRADERIYMSEDEGEESAILPDLAVLERPGQPPRAPVPGQRMAPVVVPTVMAIERRERFLTIRVPGAPEDEAVVTVIEILSPTNKRGESAEGRKAYLAKRRSVLMSPAHLVEIDLLRAGQRVPMARPLPAASYYVIVSREERRPRCDVFPIGQRDRLPVVPFPLKGDEFVELDLQELLSSVYERAGYDLDLDYGRDPIPPLDPEEAEWSRAVLRERAKP
jgi:Protein of unknown function (DUF4058)